MREPEYCGPRAASSFFRSLLFLKVLVSSYIEFLEEPYVPNSLVMLSPSDLTCARVTVIAVRERSWELLWVNILIESA
jgi:hypothetical protein